MKSGRHSQLEPGFALQFLKKDLFFIGMSGLLVCLYAHVFLVLLEASGLLVLKLLLIVSLRIGSGKQI